jgi:hypothetical protein
LICGVYIIAFECLSKLFYSFFSDYDQNRSAAGRGSQRKNGSGECEGVWVAGCFDSKTDMPPYSNMKRRMLTFMSRPTQMATVMVDEPP